MEKEKAHPVISWGDGQNCQSVSKKRKMETGEKDYRKAKRKAFNLWTFPLCLFGVWLPKWDVYCRIVSSRRPEMCTDLFFFFFKLNFISCWKICAAHPFLEVGACVCSFLICGISLNWSPTQFPNLSLWNYLQQQTFPVQIRVQIRWWISDLKRGLLWISCPVKQALCVIHQTAPTSANSCFFCFFF